MTYFSDLLARSTRFERATPAFGGQYSIQLSYEREEGAKHSRFGARRPLQQVGITADDWEAAAHGRPAVSPVDLLRGVPPTQ